MKLPNKVVFGIEGKKLIAHIPDDPSTLIEELLGLSKGRDRDVVIAATLDINLEDPGELALAIFSAEDNAAQDRGVPYDVTTGFALKNLLAKAFVEGVRYGRGKPNVTVELVGEDD